MRSCFIIFAVAVGIIISPQYLPAQFNLSPSFTEGTATSRIGVGLRDIDADRAAALKLGSVTGVEVLMVEPGSAAEQAGIKSGDVLLSYNGESIVGAQQLGRLVAETPVGRRVKIEYSRDGRVVTVTATTAARRPNNALTLNNLNMDLYTNEPHLIGAPVPMPRFSWANPQLGIECEGFDSRNSQLAEFFGVKHGVLVRSVKKDSAAAKAGLRAGDVITEVSGHAVSDPKEITYYLRTEQHFAKPLPLAVVREHKSSTLKLILNQDSPQE